MCLPYLKFSDLLPETLIFSFGLSNTIMSQTPKLQQGPYILILKQSNSEYVNEWLEKYGVFVHCGFSKGAVKCDFQQCDILTSEDSDEPLQPPFKLRNFK